MTDTIPKVSINFAPSAVSTPKGSPSCPGLDEPRALAIVLGRWTPSPDEA